MSIDSTFPTQQTLGFDKDSDYYLKSYGVRRLSPRLAKFYGGGPSLSLFTKNEDQLNLKIDQSQSLRASPLINIASSTEETSDSSEVQSNALYPHVFDENVTGKFQSLVGKSVKDSQDALDYFSEGDFSALNTSLGYITRQMKEAYSYSNFNRSVRIVISFIKRAIIAAKIEDLNRDSLNALMSILTYISQDPMLSLTQSRNQIKELEKTGWNGSIENVDNLISALFDSYDTANEENIMYKEVVKEELVEEKIN